MALVLSGTRSGAAFTFSAFFAAIVQRAMASRKAHANRQALRYLAELDESRLADLGISRADIRDALSGGRSLACRRSDNARKALVR